jgi:hypothetical protein
MRNPPYRSLLLLAGVVSLLLVGIVVLGIFLSGCTTSATTTISQEVYNVMWLPNESSGMVAFIDQLTEDEYGNEAEVQNLFQVNSSGSIGTAMNPSGTAPYTPPNGTYWNAPVVYVSSDGSTAITQFGTDIYSLPINGGNITDLIQGNALFGVSPDGKYALSTPTPAGYGYIILYTYGLTSTTPTAEPQLTRLNVISNRALWLNNDEYAFTILDSIGVIDSIVYDHVNIYDAQGDSLWSIPNADVTFSVSAFAPGSGDIFVRTPASGIDRINMNTRVRTQIVTNDTVYSMDVSADGTVLVYSSAAGSTNGTLPAYAVNTANGDKRMFASNVIIPRISPRHDMVACINNQSTGNSNINVYPLNTPP